MIIEKLYENKELKRYCEIVCGSKFDPSDIFQDFILALLEKPREKVQDMYYADALIPYSKCIIKYIVFSKTHKDHKKYKDAYIDLFEIKYINDYEYDHERDKKINFIINELKEKGDIQEDFHNIIIKKYVEEGFESLSRNTGISKQTLMKSKKYREKQIRKKWHTRRNR